MSIKIYDAYKINLNLNKSFKILKELQLEYRKEERSILYSKILKSVVKKIDLNKVEGEKFEFSLLGDFDKKLQRLSDGVSILGYHLEEYKINSKKDYLTHFDKVHDFKILLYPIRANETLIKVYFSDTHQERIFEQFLKKHSIEDYSYQNSTDKPEKISSKDWNKRIKDWKKVGIVSSPPIDCMMCFNIHKEKPNYMDGYFLKTEFSSYIPKIEDRVDFLFNRKVERLMEDIFFKDIPRDKRNGYLTSNIKEYRKQFQEYKESEKGLEIKTTIEKQLEEITWKDLCRKVSEFKYE